MKIDKKIFISVLLVLMIICVIGTASATDSLDGNLTAEDADAVSVDMSVSTQPIKEVVSIILQALKQI